MSSALVSETGELPSTYSLFQQPWWLDAVAPGAWTAVEVNENGRVAARLAFRTQRRHGLTIMTMPPLTPVLGPWIRATTGRTVSRISEEIELLESLIEQIPPGDLFRHACAPEVVNCLPFLWRDFDVAQVYTYRLDDLSDPDRIWSAMRNQTRNKIRKAEREVTVRDDWDLDAFFALEERTFRRQGKSVPFTLDYLRQIDEACAARGRRRIFVAEDATGRPHAANYIVWDDRVAYNLLAASDPDLRASGAQSLVLWEAMRFARTVSKCFDFEGSIMRPIEQFFRGFGGQLTPYVVVTRMSARMRLLDTARHLYHAAARGVRRRTTPTADAT